MQNPHHVWYHDFMLATEQPDHDHEEWSAALGHTIKVLRTDAGMSRRHLATQSGISYSYLSAIENGAKVPSAKILRVLAVRLGLQPHELYAATEARLARGRGPTDSAVDAVDAIIEDQDQRFHERQTARLGLQPSSSTSDLTSLMERLSVLPAADRAALASLDEADLAVLLTVARRLTAKGSN